MRPKPADNQNLLFTSSLEQILDHNHPSFKLADAIDWSEFEEAFGKLYDPGQGRPAKPIRLMVGLHYLKHAYDLSDEDVVARWVENPYWQYFCGCTHFEHEFPIDASLMTRWRKKVKAEGMEKLLEVTIKTGLKTGTLKLPRSLRRWLKRRSVVEAVIGHTKNECRLARNYLLGVEGDKINALLSGCGYNIRRLLRFFIFWLYQNLSVGRFYCSADLAIVTQNHF